MTLRSACAEPAQDVGSLLCMCSRDLGAPGPSLVCFQFLVLLIPSHAPVRASCALSSSAVSAHTLSYGDSSSPSFVKRLSVDVFSFAAILIFRKCLGVFQTLHCCHNPSMIGMISCSVFNSLICPVLILMNNMNSVSNFIISILDFSNSTFMYYKSQMYVLKK